MEKRKSGKMVMQKKVITETISSRRRHKSGDRYQYIKDIWEKNPKTDYTYSRSGSYASLYLRKGYVSPNMSRRSMHRDSTHSETHSNSSVIVHQDTTTTDRLNYSSDDASDDESSQDSTRAVKSTSSSVRSRKSISEQSFSHVTPSNSRLERTFSDSTTRQGTAYGIGWTIDTKGRRRRIKGLPSVARGEVQEELIDSQQQNTENSRQEYEDSSEKDKRIRYLYDESDDEDHPDGFQFNNEPLVPTVITTVTTVITSVITQLFYAPVRTVASQLQFMSNRQRTGSNENLSLFGWLWEIISTVMLAVFSLISAPVYGFWYVFTKLHEGLSSLAHFSLRTLSDGLFNLFHALYDASSYASHLLLEGLYYGVNTLRESSNILLSVVSGLWSLPAVIFRCITFMLIGLYKSVESVTRGAQSIISDGLFGLWNALCHGTAYIINGVCYPLTAITSGFRQFTSGLFRVDEDEEISQAVQVQYDSTMIEETNRPLGSFGANIGTKYGTSSARRRSSKRLRLSGKRVDDEIMDTEDNLNLTRSITKSSWLSWLQDKTSVGQIEVGKEDKKSERFLVTMDNDAEDDNIGLWLLNGIHKIFVFLLSPLSGLLSWLCWRVGSGAYGSIAEAVQSDVWLLSRTSRLRRRYGCCCLLPLLLLVPFVLSSAYYIRERGVAFPPFPILAANDSGCCVIQQGTNITDEDLRDKVQTILVGLLADQERKQQQLYANQHKEMNEIQATALVNHRVELEKWVHGLLKDEFAAFATAQNNKEQDYVRAREAAEAAAAATARSEENKADKDYTHLAAQINQIGTRNEGIVADLGAQIAALQTKADALSQELSATEESGKQLVGAEREAREEAIVLLKDQLTSLRSDVASLEVAQAVLLGRMSECCKNDSALLLLIKKAVQDEMALLMGGSSGGAGWFGGGGDAASSGGFMGWLSSRFAQRDDVDAKIAALAARLTDQIEAIPVTNAQGQPDMMYLHDGVELNAQQVRVMIREALLLYGADKTGQPDYALESAGGSVISTRCSETYHRRTAQLSLFGIPLWYASNSPRSVIQPDVHPGQCWAFKGTQGYLVIQLSGEIYPTAFALEHIPKGLSPTGNIDSAPKDFSVSGLTSERDTEGILLGNFTYREDGEPLQHFAAKEPSTRSYSYVELRIHSNHGNPEYTCLYRFRVHGNLRRW